MSWCTKLVEDHKLHHNDFLRSFCKHYVYSEEFVIQISIYRNDVKGTFGDMWYVMLLYFLCALAATATVQSKPISWEMDLDLQGMTWVKIFFENVCP